MKLLEWFRTLLLGKDRVELLQLLKEQCDTIDSLHHSLRMVYGAMKEERRGRVLTVASVLSRFDGTILVAKDVVNAMADQVDELDVKTSDEGDYVRLTLVVAETDDE